MTTARHYTCNLCREHIEPSNVVTKRAGFGVHFHAYTPPTAGAWLTFKRPRECETHICLACAKAVHDELRKVTPAAAAQAAPIDAAVDQRADAQTGANREIQR